LTAAAEEEVVVEEEEGATWAVVLWSFAVLPNIGGSSSSVTYTLIAHPQKLNPQRVNTHSKSARQ
jgi:hypothetical protein